MPLYLVVHTPKTDLDENTVFPPTDMEGMAEACSLPEARTRWIKTWSPDLRDERHFTLWEAKTAADIEEVMDRYHFLEEMDSHPICVQEWSPASVLTATRSESVE